jgi:hypothetical protein
MNNFSFEIKREIWFDDVYDECNSEQERDVLDKIIDNHKEDELMQLLAEECETMEEISDLIFHEWEYIYDRLDIDEDAEDDEMI